jgi:hypothetical protein
MEETQQVSGLRWIIEQRHREGKQITGLERCQCRTAQIQRNHIGCALLVWVRLKQLAAQTGRTVYQLQYGLLDDYLCLLLRSFYFIMMKQVSRKPTILYESLRQEKTSR